ncbi:hypothetical protein, partial [Plesiomonas sp.]|uniref:hypothetical protein n=1 Tax=Plesiomonas sp. TaxID=2486279 RepID=UPI003F312E13
PSVASILAGQSRFQAYLLCYCLDIIFISEVNLIAAVDVAANKVKQKYVLFLHNARHIINSAGRNMP